MKKLERASSVKRSKKKNHVVPPAKVSHGKKALRVLISDDHDIVHRGLRHVLVESFKQVEFGHARTLEATLDLCKKRGWDVILLDLHMPGRGGIELLGEIAAMAPETPILIMSTYPEEEFAIHTFRSGARGYLTKRSLAELVVTAIKTVLKGERYVSAALASKLAGKIANHKLAAAHEALSGREFQVLCLVASGKTIKEIAHDLSLSEKTVGTFRTRISKKLGLCSNVELTRYAIRHRLVE